MVEHASLFVGAMVRAILKGRKQQTRRVVKPQPETRGTVIGDGPAWYWRGGKGLLRAGYGADYVHTGEDALRKAMVSCCPYGVPGDLLIPRCTWAVPKRWDDWRPLTIPPYADAWTDWFWSEWSDGPKPDWAGKSRLGRFCPKHAWHNFPRLSVLDVRVQRVQEISEEDAVAEGARCAGFPASLTDRGAFAKLWDSINARRGYGWEANLWVWAITFTRRLTDG